MKDSNVFQLQILNRATSNAAKYSPIAAAIHDQGAAAFSECLTALDPRQTVETLQRVSQQLTWQLFRAIRQAHNDEYRAMEKPHNLATLLQYINAHGDGEAGTDDTHELAETIDKLREGMAIPYRTAWRLTHGIHSADPVDTQESSLPWGTQQTADGLGWEPITTVEDALTTLAVASNKNAKAKREKDDATVAAIKQIQAG